MRRIAFAIVALVLFAACAGGSHPAARPAAHDDLSAIEALPSGPLRNGATGAPIGGIMVSGTITNTDSQNLRCGGTTFLLVSDGNNAITPASQFCDTPLLAPNRSGYFSVTFATAAHDNLQLRFEHPDGTYEVHDLVLPPQ